MKAAKNNKYGRVRDVLMVQEVEKPQPKNDEVLVKVINASLNSWDHDLITGLPRIYRLIFGLFKPKYPIPGIDIAGTVEAIGNNVTNFKIDDAVFGDISESEFGGFAEFVCVKEKSLVLKPDNISFEHASTLPHAGGLAHQGLLDYRPITKGNEILINGAGGCAGPIALQIAKHFGAIVTVVDKAEKLDKLKALGADHVIDYKKEDFTKNKKQYDLILELIGNRSIFKYKKCLKPQGVLSISGGTINCIMQAGILGPMFSRKTGKKMGILILKPNSSLPELLKLYEQKVILPIIEKNYPLAEIAIAIERMGACESFGKIVIQDL